MHPLSHAGSGRPLSQAPATADPIQATAPPPPPASRRGAEQEESIKETIESIVIALILAFVFRAYVVEAFVIPTGSMAPTLLGQHLRFTCEQCGYRFTADPEDESRGEATRGGRLVRNYLTQQVETACPMCRNTIVALPGTRVSAGDRILVHKFIYSFSEPKRWDVVVFKNPQEPYVNYIKRLVGLPNEELWILHGNIYAKSAGEEDFSIARKSEREDAQRAVWQPIYHSLYVPLDYAERTTGPSAWRVPWVARRGQWELEGRRSYLCPDESGGRLEFDFSRALPPSNAWYAYNQLKAGYLSQEPIEDVRVAAAFEPASAGLEVTLSTSARLGLENQDAGTLPLRAAIDAQGRVTLSTDNPNNREVSVLLAETQVPPLAPHRATEVELWYVDQEASLWVDGEKVLAWGYDLDFETIRRRRPPAITPEVSIEVRGSAVTLHRVEVDRDIFYSDHNQNQPARGSLRSRQGLAPQPVELGPDHFFCLGDNSPLSLDSRYWKDPEGWIEHRMFTDWIAQDKEAGGLVPRDLMMGRAFFVYFPAPYGLDSKARGFIPNFGDMRFIR